MRVIKSVEAIEVEGDIYRLAADEPLSLVYDSGIGPVPSLPDDEHIQGITFISSREFARSGNRRVTIGFSRQAEESLGVLLDAIVSPGKEIACLRAIIEGLERDVRTLTEINDSDARTIGLLEKQVARGDETLRAISRLSFWRRLKFLFGWPIGSLISNKETT